jgi:cGMP-dependent protein kinase
MGCAAGVPVKDAGAPAKAELEVVVPPSPLGKQQSVQKADTGKEFIKITNKQCSQIRLDTSQEVKKIPVTGQMHDFTAHYCYVSQKGYYPNALGKANQDSYLVTEAILGDKSCNLFGIFDGHGEYGDYCSFYAADSFPGHLAYELKTNGGLSALDGAKMQDLYTRAFLNTNFGLHSSKIDDSLSGTTGVTILQRGDKLYVANVGDSRAIIASEVDGKLKYSPLSIDQTPYRKDERERLKRAVSSIEINVLILFISCLIDHRELKS